jgi:hypothetical protein
MCPMATDPLAPDKIHWPVIFSAGTKIEFAPANVFGPAYFGGPLEQKFSGQQFGPEPLHRLFTFSAAALPQPKGNYLQGRMGVFFGLRYDGCELQYRVPVLEAVNAQYIQSTSPIDVRRVSPNRSSDEWPYADYPRLLPYVQMKEVSRTPMQAQEFASTHTWQGVEAISEDDLVVIVPAVATLGVSLWGRSGDEEAVQVVFRYSYSTHNATVCSQCT